MVSNEFDAHIGARIRDRRLLLGLSQTTLAKALGVGFQQIHKYEAGFNQITCRRLYALSTALGVPVAHFFQGLPESADGASANAVASQCDRQTIKLVTAYRKIGDRALQKRVLDLVEELSASK